MNEEEYKGKKVTNANGTAPGTDTDMVKFAFSGSPTDLFELAPEAGEVRVMTITAQCTNGTHKRLTRDGTQLVAGWAVREVTVGRVAQLADRDDPNQAAIDDPDQSADAGDAVTDAEAEAERANIASVPDPFAVPVDSDADDDDPTGI